MEKKNDCPYINLHLLLFWSPREMIITFKCTGLVWCQSCHLVKVAKIYSVINLILPNSKQLLWHFFTNKQVDVLGDFNLEFWYILLFEVRFWIFRISFFAQNGDNSKGYPLENLKSHHLWFEKCFLITKCIKISVIKIISKLT